MCGWYQDLSSDFKWVLSTGQGQGSDHTTSSGKGLVALWGNPGAWGIPKPSIPRANICPVPSQQPSACGASSPRAAWEHPDLGWG